MTDIAKKQTATFWEAWSPHLADLEDNHLDLPAIEALGSAIGNPVLVIGAGHGLLVADLRNKGLRADGIDSCREMIAYACERRQVDLTEADAAELPFPSGCYQTALIATGVIDFLDDERQIRRIVDEAVRVTRTGGNVLAAFYKPHAAAERFLKRIGLITPEGRIRQRRIFELSRLDPWSFIRAVREDANLSLPAALAELLRMRLGLPKREQRTARNLARILKTAADPEKLIQAVPESIPYRREQDIKALFERLQTPVGRIWVFDPCIVIETIHAG